MKLIQLAEQNPLFMKPASADQWSDFVAWGPAGARTATALSYSRDPAVNLLRLFAADPRHDPNVVGRIADAWLDGRAEQLLGPPEPWLGGARMGFLPPATEIPPSWEVLASADIDRVLEGGPELFSAHEPGGTWHGLPINQDFAIGGGQLAGSLMKHGGAVSHLAMEAADADDTAGSITKPTVPVTRESFMTVAGVVGAGGAGVLAAGIAHSLGLGGLLTAGAGIVAGALSLWKLTDRLPAGDLSAPWGFLTGLADKAVEWLLPGNSGGLGGTPGPPEALVVPAAALPARIKSEDPGILDDVAGGIIELFS